MMSSQLKLATTHGLEIWNIHNFMWHSNIIISALHSTLVGGLEGLVGSVESVITLGIKLHKH